MKVQLVHTYNDIISLDNLFSAWQEFAAGKRTKADVQEFSRNLMDNIVNLHEDLVNKAYRHGGYYSFYINDPKRRHIHKTCVRDRLLHHAVYRILYSFFERTFVADSFSCRDDKGIHRALKRFKTFHYKVSNNHTKTCWVLKCDIRKFFASIDHEILKSLLKQYIPDIEILRLLENIIDSFCMNVGTEGNKRGLPLGNLTSQLLTNVYMNVFDQWVKHRLKAKYYIRYADDFVFLSNEQENLISLIPKVRGFLENKLHLILHPDKIILKTLASGVDFLGWVNFTDHCVLRKATHRRMLRRLYSKPEPAVVQSYLGLLKHGNALKVREEVFSHYWLWHN